MNNLVLKHAVTSTAGNQIITPNGEDFYLGSNDAVLLVYDYIQAYWRVTGVRRVHDHSNAQNGGTLTDSAISATAEIAVSKLADGDALALLRTASDGVTVEWGTAGQIVFPATQAASANGNTLDDYEKGTGTFTIQCLTTPGTNTYTSNTYRYVKIGDTVNIELPLGVNVKNSSGAAADGIPFLTALPFTGSGGNDSGLCCIYFSQWNLTTNYTQDHGLISGTSVFPIQSQDSANVAFHDDPDFTSGSTLIYAGSYNV